MKPSTFDVFANMAIHGSICGILAYAAFGTAWHAALFAYIGALIYAVGNRLHFLIYKLAFNMKTATDEGRSVHWRTDLAE